MLDSQDGEAVCLAIPDMPVRRIIGSILMLPMVLVACGVVYVVYLWVTFGAPWTFLALLPLLLISPLAAFGLPLARMGLEYFGGVQTVTIKKDKLISRIQGRVGPAFGFVQRVRLSRVHAPYFIVVEFPRDAIDGAFRPSFMARIRLTGVHGPLLDVGFGLTLAEGHEACEALNHLLNSGDRGAQ